MPTRRPHATSPVATTPPDLLTVAETAAVLRCGLTFVYESIHRFRATGDESEIPGIKVGRSLRVPRVQLERYVGSAITWPIVDHPIVDDTPGDVNDNVTSIARATTPRRPSHRPTEPRLFES
jgi:excisionase family DNA binding protein